MQTEDPQQFLRWFAVPRAFLMLSLIFGTILVFLTPPFQAADEPYHFLRAYQVSQGVITPMTYGRARGGILPTSIYGAWKPFSELSFTSKNRTSRKIILAALHLPLDPGTKRFFKFSNTANYSPIGYLPQAAAIAIGRCFSLPPLALLYLGRESNLLCWIAIAYASLRIIPTMRLGMFLLMVMPMTLSLAATVSLDAFTNAIALFVTAYILRLASPDQQSKPLRWNSILRLGLTTAALAVSKIAYAPLLALLCLIPSERFSSRRVHALVLTGLAALSWIAVSAWLSRTGGTDVDLRTDVPQVNARLQLEYLEHHLAEFPLTLWQSINLGWIHGFVGKLGWTDTPVPPAFAIAYGIALLVTCYPRANDPPAPSWRALTIIFLGIFSSFVVIGVLNYLVWTPVGLHEIHGFQGRYFIPLAPAILLIVWSGGQSLPPKFRLDMQPRKLDLIAAGIGMASCLCTVIIIYLRYFGP